MQQQAKHILASFLLLFTLCGALSAQIPDGYYNNATGKTGQELKVALHNIIKGHDAVSYGGLLDAFAYTDCDSNGKIWDIYSNYQYSINDNGSSFTQEGQGWNREHTWPQSWFNEQSTPRTDLFQVYPTDGYVNGRRSSYPYGEVRNPTYTSGNGSKLGPCVTSGYSGTVFEPIDEYKGDIARGYFYMSVRYYSEDSNWGTSDMTNKSIILDWALTMLLRWSDEDPVSQKEIDRNNAIYGYQNNRNPFIDHPEYARMIWDENWEPPTAYSITLAHCEHGEVCTNIATATEGQTITLTAEPDEGYVLDAWNVYKTDSPTITVTVSNNAFAMPAYGVTVSATFVESSGGSPGNGDYVKVTSAPSDWSGEYLLVYENSTTSGYVWTGVDAANCYQEAAITNSTIENSGFVTITIAPMTEGYSIRVNGGTNDGKYIYGQSGSNVIKFGTSATLNTLEFESDWVKIISNTSVMKFNNASGNMRFRYYKEASYLNTNIEPIQLYKKTEPQTVEQSISLVAGWNWWAPTVEATLASLQTALGDAFEQIKSQGGTPTELVLGQMYKIQTNAASECSLIGAPAASITITIEPGYNWFGYKGTEPMALDELNIIPVEGDKIVSQNSGFAVFNGTSWQGTLSVLLPGCGYVYVSAATENNTLTF
ncbi:MAG: endonuclease [Bacteroidales bacterium]|nr:endonuclease [Bacteroidales bacterium]